MNLFLPNVYSYIITFLNFRKLSKIRNVLASRTFRMTNLKSVCCVPLATPSNVG
jgi:hypothetical protein